MSRGSKPVAQAVWSISQADIDSITMNEMIYGTDRLLPPMSDIPHAFHMGNIYTRIAEAMYVGDKPAHGEVTFLPGFREDGSAMTACVLAHVKCILPEYDHKIAGVGYMISKIVHITVILT